METHTIAMITASVVTVFITFLLNKYLHNRSKLVTYCLHASVHKIKNLKAL